jgi:hypothetical protein
MRTVVVALMLSAGQTLTAQAQNPALTGPWADKLFKGAISHDFGTVPRGAQLTHRFTLTNLYAVDLQIVNIRSSCGCVTTTVTPASRLLKSKQTGFIDVLMDTRKFSGAKTIMIYVTVGPEYTSTATLKVSAFSRGDVVLNPGEVNFGIVPKGLSVNQVVDVEYAGVVPWQITEVVKHNAPLDVELTELYRHPGRVGYRLLFTLKANAPSGPLKREVQLKTNDKISPILPILVEATIQPSLTVAPSVVAMDSLSRNETKMQRVVVRGNKPFQILAIEGLGDGITAVVPKTLGTVHFVTIKCQPTKVGMLSKQLVIKTNLEDEATTTMTIEANVTE